VANTVSFKYDPFGRRIYKSSSSGTSIYAYDGDDLIEEKYSTGAVVARYTLTTDKVDEPLAMLRSGATSYYDADGLGSVTSLLNAAGSTGANLHFRLIRESNCVQRLADKSVPLYCRRVGHRDQPPIFKGTVLRPKPWPIPQ
jgi:hypothetical protein